MGAQPIGELDEYYELFFRGNRLYSEYAKSRGESLQSLFLMRLLLKRERGLCQRDIAQLLGIPKQTLSRQLKEKIADGLVEQSPGEADKREKVFSLTEAGCAAARTLIEPLDAVELQALAAIGDGLAESNDVNKRYLDAFEKVAFGANGREER